MVAGKLSTSLVAVRRFCACNVLSSHIRTPENRTAIGGNQKRRGLNVIAILTLRTLVNVKLAQCFERLERLAFFRRDYLRAFRNMADELRARTNYELTETLRDGEQRESAQFGRIRAKWERRFRDDTPQRPPNRKRR
jgi:hypothetical protein